MSRRLGLLWLKSTEDEFYMSGYLEDITGDIPIKIVKNEQRLEERHAPYVILRKQEHYDQFDKGS